MELRFEIYKSSVYQYEIAERLGISKWKLNRLLQRDISKDQEESIYKALRDLEKERKESGVFV